MGLRQKINENPGAASIVGIAILVIGIALIIWQAFGGSGSGRGFTHQGDKAFFSDNDGQSWFIDSSTNVPPFNHNGKTAYRAELFRCGNGKAFIAYLAKYSDEDKKRIEGAIKSGHPVDEAFAGAAALVMIKKPGAGHQWVTRRGQTSSEFSSLFRPFCPDNNEATHLTPSDKVD